MEIAKLIIGDTTVHAPGIVNESNCPETLIWDQNCDCAKMDGEISFSASVSELQGKDDLNQVRIRIDTNHVGEGHVYFLIDSEQALFLRDFLDTFLKLDAKLNPPE